MMGIEEPLKEKRQDILRVAALHGAYNVCVFGSVVRGDASPNSDVDLLVEVGPVHSSWSPAGLVADIENLLGRKVDVVTKEALHWYIRDRVLREAMPL